jgi:hypothetical protein
VEEDSLYSGSVSEIRTHGIVVDLHFDTYTCISKIKPYI